MSMQDKDGNWIFEEKNKPLYRYYHKDCYVLNGYTR